MRENSLEDWIANLFNDSTLQLMGHEQRLDDLNLGMGWLYYGLGRLLRPQVVVVIGSYRGFAPLVFGKALQDNVEEGKVIFVDPSKVDDFWKDGNRVREHWRRFQVDNIHHFLMTTQEFRNTDSYRQIERVGLLFIDGYHTAEQACLDFEAFQALLPSEGVALFHDSVTLERSNIYGRDRSYLRTVCKYMAELERRDDLEVLNFPFSSGLTLVRKKNAGPGQNPS